MDTRTVTAASERGSTCDVLEPALVLMVDRARPLEGGARHSLANIDLVAIGRGRRRSASRLVEDDRRTLRLLLPDERVSLVHARIERLRDRWQFTDCA